MDINEIAQRKTEATRLPLFREEGQVDGRGKEAADRREEGRRRARVLAAVADYLGNRKRRHR